MTTVRWPASLRELDLFAECSDDELRQRGCPDDEDRDLARPGLHPGGPPRPRGGHHRRRPGAGDHGRSGGGGRRPGRRGRRDGRPRRRSAVGHGHRADADRRLRLHAGRARPRCARRRRRSTASSVTAPRPAPAPNRSRRRPAGADRADRAAWSEPTDETRPQGPSSPGDVAGGRAAGERDHVRVRPARPFAPFAGGRHAARPRCDRRPELEPRPRGAQRALPRRRPRPPGARTGHRRRRAVHPRGLRRRRRRPRRRARRRAGHLRRLLDGRADRPAGLASPRRAGPGARAVRDVGRVLLARPSGGPSSAPSRSCTGPPASSPGHSSSRAHGPRWPASSSAPTQRQDLLDALRRHDPLAVRDAAQAVLGFSSTEWIGDVTVPTAVVVTERDHLVPTARQRDLAARIPGASVVALDGNHMVFLTEPEALAAAVLEACRAVTAAAPTVPATAGRTRRPSRAAGRRYQVRRCSGMASPAATSGVSSQRAVQVAAGEPPAVGRAHDDVVVVAAVPTPGIVARAACRARGTCCGPGPRRPPR